MKKVREIVITTFITAALVFIIAFCISGTVFSQNKSAGQAKAQYYRAMEQEYVQEIRTLLEEMGYSDSGVMMTRVIGEDGAREYTVMIHHKKILKLDDDRKRELIEACRMIDFPVEDCSFRHEFLETDL